MRVGHPNGVDQIQGFAFGEEVKGLRTRVKAPGEFTGQAVSGHRLVRDREHGYQGLGQAGREQCRLGAAQNLQARHAGDQGVRGVQVGHAQAAADLQAGIDLGQVGSAQIAGAQRNGRQIVGSRDHNGRRLGHAGAVDVQHLVVHGDGAGLVLGQGLELCVAGVDGQAPLGIQDKTRGHFHAGDTAVDREV